MNYYLKNKIQKLINETLEDKANEVMEKLKLNKPGKSFDYVEEGEMCESCGGEMNEGECSECGNMYEIDLQELGGMDDGHPRFGKTKFKNQMTNDEIEKLLRGDDDADADDDENDYGNLSMHNPYYGDDSNMYADDDETEDGDMDTGEDLAPSFDSDGNFLGMVKPNRDGMEVDDDDLKESFFIQKNKITEMFNRLNKYN